MAELKRVFSKAIMNKDMDERLVPNGQHRDALNIQIATSDGSDVGSVQTLKGNTLNNTMASSSGVYDVNTRSTCVGSIGSVARDKIYYFIDAGTQSGSANYNTIQKDYILEYDVVTGKHKYVFVDIYDVKVVIASSTNQAQDYLYIPDLSSSTTGNKTGVRIGMSVTGTLNGSTYTPADGITVSDIIWDTDKWKIKMVKHSGYDLTAEDSFFQPPNGVAVNDVINFTSERVLNFKKDVVITGINILDDFIYWTDNFHEPKKININRSIAGTGGTAYLTNAGLLGSAATTTATNAIFSGDTDYYHTRDVREKSRFVDSHDMEIVTSADGKRAVYVEESDITVIKKSPVQKLKLDMLRTNPTRVSSSGVENASHVTWFQAFPELSEDEDIDVDFGTLVDFRAGDILLIRIADTDSTQSDTEFTDYDIRAQVVKSNVLNADNLFQSGFKLHILSKAPIVTPDNVSYTARLDDVDPLFEFKFPRFSYRYKYQDGEYSTFAPWSEVAFLTDTYEYEPTKGYNHGMINQLRSLTLKNYHANEGVIPGGVIEIDLLYKETNNPTVYTVKTIKRTDAHPAWPDFTQDDSARGEYTLTTDMIHAVVPSSQLLRPWDNVPRRALAQEVSANRLIYGNYLQNYTVTKDPIVNLSTVQKAISTGSHARPSVKSNRIYQGGVVFSDGYGRETPVLTHENSSVRIPKAACGDWNRLKYSLSVDSEIPNWAKYYSFYVKETSVEYHTMAMDRWYDAWDGNIWLSFPSSDRNKVDEETFIVLKKQHGNDSPVTEKARYKILAIENEAPDYIKTVAKSYGTFPGGGPTTWTIGSTGGTGWPYVGSVFIEVDQTSFETACGANFLDSTKEGLTARIYNTDNVSKEYPIASVVLSGQNYKITFEEPLGDDLAFAAPTGEGSSRVSDLNIEIIGHNVENRPEFDGRFFVKVYKDLQLEESILALSNPEAQLVVTSAYDLGYLNNNAFGVNPVQENGISTTTHYTVYSGNTDVLNPNKLTAGSYIDVGDDNDNSYSDYDLHPTEHGYHRNPTGSGNVEYAWASGGLGGAIQNESPLKLNTDSQDFWDWVGTKEMFFIDAASEWSLTGYKDDFPGRRGDWYNQNWDESWWNSLGSGSKKAAEQQSLLDQSDDTGVSPAETFGNMKEGSGISGRGIWDAPNVDDASIIDISWSGMGSGWRDETMTGSLSTGNLQYDQIHQQLGQVPDGGNNGKADATFDDNISYGNAWEFIQKLTATGTKFKFSNDPEGVVYTVLSNVIPQATAGASGDSGAGFLDGFNSSIYWKDDSSKEKGIWGIRNFQDSNSGSGSNENVQWRGSNLRQRWSIMVSPKIGNGGDNGYNPVTGTNPPAQGGPAYDNAEDKYRRALHHDLSETTQIQILEPHYSSSGSAGGGGKFVTNPAVWETEPKESVDLDIYYQVSDLIPLELNSKTNEEFLPVGSTFNAKWFTGLGYDTHTITKWITDRTFKFTPDLGSQGNSIASDSLSDSGTLTGRHLFKKHGSRNNLVTAVVNSSENMPSPGAYVSGDEITIQGGPETTQGIQKLFSQEHTLDWNNCWSFGNGVESDRIRDDFNAPQMDNGVKASSILEEQAREERRKHGLIWSGIYNSNAGVNNTNQFIMAEAITKDLNPVYGSIQSLLNKDTRLVMFCEDKVLRAVTNKDALYNADGKPQLVASNAVIGDVQAYQGDFGISKNPESMVTTPYKTYFTDVNRNQVLSLSTEGVRSISNLGMRDYFADTMKTDVWRALGTYDPNKTEYNLTISKKYSSSQVSPHEQTTVSFSEGSGGWISFKSFHPQSGVGINNDYYTFNGGQIYKHHTNETRNYFYGEQYMSDITMLFNDSPDSVKNFSTINYEGTQARVSEFDSQTVEYYNNDYDGDEAGESDGLTTVANENDGEYFNLAAKTGWYADNITTNLQTCDSIEFKDKEGKWFGTPAGEAMGAGSSDIPTNNKGAATVQGIGMASITHSDSNYVGPITITVKNYTYFYGTLISWDTTTQTENSNWACNTVTYNSAVSGGTIAADQVVNLTITPVGEFSLAAANLEVPEPASVAGNVYTIDGDSHVSTVLLDGAPYPNNVDVETITFSDNGAPGHEDNTVNVAVKFKAGQTWPTSDATYWIDIDDKTTPTFSTSRKTCLAVTYDFYDTDHQVLPSYADITDIAESELDAGGNVNASTGPTNRHTGTVPSSGATEIATYTFSRAGTYYYTPVTVKWENLGVYEDYYSFAIDETYDADNLLTDFVVHLYYTPPQVDGLINDPESFCGLDHKAIIVYSILQPETATTQETLFKFQVDGLTDMGFGGTSGVASITGTDGAAYNIYLQKKHSVTSDATAASGGYYNFTTQLFQDNPPPLLEGVISSTTGFGQSFYEVVIPPVSVNTRYDFTVDGGPVDGVLSGIQAGNNIPTAPGESSWIQSGVAAVVFEVGQDTTDNFVFDTASDFNKPIGVSNSAGSYSESTNSAKGDHSSTTTKITLENQAYGIVAGMYVMNPFGMKSGGAGAVGPIQHKTKVVSVSNNVVIIDKPLQETLLDTAELLFVLNNSTVVPFEIAVTPGSSITAIAGVNATYFGDMMGGMSGVKILTSEGRNNVVHVLDNIKGVMVGMKVTGDGIVGANNAGYTYVSSILTDTDIALDTVEDLANNAKLTFSIGDPATPGIEPGLKLLDMQAQRVDNDNAKIQGYLRSYNITGSIDLPVYVGDIFTITTATP